MTVFVFLYKAGITVSHFPKSMVPQWLRFCASPNPTASREPLLSSCARSLIFRLLSAVLGSDSDNLQVGRVKHIFQKPVRKRKSDTSMIKHELEYKNTTL